MNYKKILAILTVSVMVCSLLTSCANPFAKKVEEEAEEPVLDVTTAFPVVQNMSISSDFSATVEADSEVKVIPKVAGEVIEKNFEVGDHVYEGELLFAIDDEPYQIAMKQAQAGLSTARSNYTSQQAATALARISGVETVGTMPTEDQKYSNAIDSAYAQAVTAGNSLKTQAANNEYNEDQLQQLKDDLDDAEDEKDRAKEAGDAAAYATADAKVDQLEKSIEQMELSIKTGGYSAGTAETNYYVAQEGVDMAIRQKADHELYGKSTTLYSVNNSVVGADMALSNAQQNIKTAEANVENAQLSLDNTKVTAPVSGTITAINVTLHNMASQSEPAYIIESDAKNKIIFYVAEETAAYIKPGNTAILKKGGKEYASKITSILDTLDSATGLFKVEASADADNLITGSDVIIRTTTRSADRALSIPLNAVYYDQEQAYVLVNEGNVAVRRDVTTGLADEKYIEITGGIDENSEVIVSYSTQLKTGTKINPKKKSSSGKTKNMGLDDLNIGG